MRENSVPEDPYPGVPTGYVPRANFVRVEDPNYRAPTATQTTTASRTQIGGNHYAKCKVQPWDYVAANDLGYFEGSIIKYVTRWRDKGGVEDLKKARHFLDKLIEVSGD